MSFAFLSLRISGDARQGEGDAGERGERESCKEEQLLGEGWTNTTNEIGKTQTQRNITQIQY